MKVIYLVMLIIGNNGKIESKQVISKHDSYLSCKVEQYQHENIKSKITFVCSNSKNITLAF